MKALILGTCLLLALPVAAAAQSATLPPSSAPRMHVPGSLVGNLPVDLTRAEREQGLRDDAGTPSERRERAQRLAALVNSGQCQAARDAALHEGDRAMAQRVNEVCRSATAASSAS